MNASRRQRRTIPVAAQLGVIVLVSFVARALFLESNLDRDWPYSIFFYGDSQHFHAYARALGSGELYDRGIPFHPPLYPWLLHMVYELLGTPRTSGHAHKLVMAALNAVTVGLAWLWFRRMLGASLALAGAAVLALHFGWLVLSASFDSEVLYLLLSTPVYYLVWRERSALTARGAVAAGALMALAALTHAPQVSLWPFLLAYLAWMRDRHVPLVRHVSRWALALAVFLLVLAPWAARNYVRLGAYNRQTAAFEPLPRLALVTAYGPLNFALANSAHADGGFSPRLIREAPGGGMVDLEQPAQRELFVHGYRVGLTWLGEHPAEAVGLLRRKLDRWLDGLRLGLGVTSFPTGLAGERPPVDVFVPDPAWLEWLLAAWLVAGIALSFRSGNRDLSLCTLIVAHRVAITLLFYGYARGLLVVLPVLVPLGLLPLREIARARVPALERWVAAAALAGTAALLIHATIVATRPPRELIAGGTTDPRGMIVQDDRVRIWPKDLD